MVIYHQCFTLLIFMELLNNSTNYRDRAVTIIEKVIDRVYTSAQRKAFHTKYAEAQL